jgi:hypothetical protein
MGFQAPSIRHVLALYYSKILSDSRYIFEGFRTAQLIGIYNYGDITLQRKIQVNKNCWSRYCRYIYVVDHILKGRTASVILILAPRLENSRRFISRIVLHKGEEPY